jgi:hypothetical protein
VPEQPTDPGNVFLQWLESLLLPDWGGLMNLLPILLILGMLGPALTLLAIYWFYVRVTTRRGRVRIDDPEPAPAPRDAAGEPVYPANVPYCPTHAMIYPPNGQTCEVDGEALPGRPERARRQPADLPHLRNPLPARRVAGTGDGAPPRPAAGGRRGCRLRQPNE